MSRRSLWLGVLLILTTSASAQTEISKQLKAGDEALTRFDLDAALAAYRNAHQLVPDNYEATWKLARAFADKATLSNDRVEQKTLCIEAESLARDAVRLNPGDTKGHTFLAIAVGKLALYEGGKRKVELSKEVKTEAETALKLDQGEDLAHHVLGVWNREMVELNWMLRRFAELLYGKFPPASLDESVSHLRRAAELAPSAVAHHVELGLTLIDAQKCAEGQRELTNALTMPKTWVTDDYYRDLAKRNRRRCAGT